jgi:hypothetical protein
MQCQKPLLLAALTTGATLGFLALAPSAQAIAIYTLNNVQVNGGGTVNGSFTYNTDPSPNGTYTNVVLEIIGGDFAWSGTDLLVAAGGSNADQLFVNNAHLNGILNPAFRSIGLYFATPLNGTPGQNVALSTSSSPSSYVTRGGFPNSFNEFITSGSLTATPVPLESDALPIVGAVAFMAGGMWFKRRRVQAKANLDFLGVASEK